MFLQRVAAWPARKAACRPLILAVVLCCVFLEAGAQTSTDLKWSTDYTAKLELERLSTPRERASAVEECRRLHISKVYLEVTEGRGVDTAFLRTARDAFQQAGIEASALVATEGLPKPSTVPSGAACYTNSANRKYVTRLFEKAAASFDQIIIDDWLFTDCTCSECSAAKGGTSWEQYRRKLMLDVSRNDILGPARKINPRVQVILKYPNWYDNFQKWGYRVAAETALYDRIWVGTEMRDPSSEEHKQQYGGFFLYRWMAGIGGKKLGGAWYDLYNMTPTFYLDQAYVSVLAGAPEIMLYSDSHAEASMAAHPTEMQTLIDHQANLDALATLVGNWQGIPAYKPPSSNAGSEEYIFDRIGMLGIPLLPVSRFPENSKEAFFADYAMKDPEFIPELVQFFARGGTAFVSQDLAHRLDRDPRLPVDERLNLRAGEYLKKIAEGAGRMIIVSDALPALTIVDASNRVAQPTAAMRAALLELRQNVAAYMPLSLDAQPRVAVFPMGRRIAVMNFNETPVDCHLNGTNGSQLTMRTLLATPGAALRQDHVTLHLGPHEMLMLEILSEHTAGH